MMAERGGGLTARRRSMAMIRSDERRARDRGDSEAARAFEQEALDLWDENRQELNRLRAELGWSVRFTALVLETLEDHVMKMGRSPEAAASKAPSPRSLRLLRACLAMREAGILDQWLRDEGITE